MPSLRSLRCFGSHFQKLLKFPGCSQHLVRSGAHPNVLSEIHPPHHAGRIHKKLRWPGNVAALRASAFVEQMVTANRLSIGIRKDRKCVSGLGRQFARDFGRVHADGHRLYAGFGKLFQIFLNAS